MKKHFFKNAVGWGILLWLFGYILGIILFMFIPESYLYLIIMPLGTALTLWVLFKKVKSKSFHYYFWLAVIWTLIAIVFDYLFLVKLFNSTNYYSFHIYLYYFLTFALPIFIGCLRSKNK